MSKEKDPFITDKPLIDYSIEYNYDKLPKYLIELIHELEELDKKGDWFNYDIKFSVLEIETKSYYRDEIITEYDFKTTLSKYGWLYD